MEGLGFRVYGGFYRDNGKEYENTIWGLGFRVHGLAASHLGCCQDKNVIPGFRVHKAEARSRF